jgi:hypothetical protein
MRAGFSAIIAMMPTARRFACVGRDESDSGLFEVKQEVPAPFWRLEEVLDRA